MTTPPRRSDCSGSESAAPTPSARMLGVLGDEWTLLIVQQALLGATRYGDFAARLPISHAVLTDRLQSLTDDDLLERRELPDESDPLRVR